MEEDGQEDSTHILIEMPMTLLRRLGMMEQMKILTLAREVAEDLVKLLCLIIPESSSSKSEEDAVHSDEEFPLEENDVISDREEEADEGEEDVHSGDIRPRRDRLVHDIESARDPGNYNR